MFGRLLIRVRELDQRRLAVSATEERDADRKIVREARGHVDVRISGDRGRRRARAGEMIPID